VEIKSEIGIKPMKSKTELRDCEAPDVLLITATEVAREKPSL
jgi:hypothetical protein